MGKIVISENVSLDGVVQEPAGDEGFRVGGWVGRITDRPEVGRLGKALGVVPPQATFRILAQTAATPRDRAAPSGKTGPRVEPRCERPTTDRRRVVLDGGRPPFVRSLKSRPARGAVRRTCR
jgi:hypothetical protein